MERSREYDDISRALAELRPEPRPDFAAELDALVATGFQSGSRGRRSPVANLATRFRALSPQRLLFTTGGAALATIAIATIVVTSVDSGSTPVALDQHAANERLAAKPSAQFSKQATQASNPLLDSRAANANSEALGAEGLKESSASLSNPN